jgi:hypothetical protein
MAFDYSKLSRIGGMGDAQKVYNELQVNDVIFVSDSDAAAVTVTFVKSNTGTAIDCASGTALGDA